MLGTDFAVQVLSRLEPLLRFAASESRHDLRESRQEVEHQDKS
jgi:hypothetical protein